MLLWPPRNYGPGTGPIGALFENEPDWAAASAQSRVFQNGKKLRRLRRDCGLRVGITISIQQEHFLEEPVSERNNLRARFDAGRLDQPVTGGSRDRVVDCDSRPAGG
jgi:hypothetical protein